MTTRKTIALIVALLVILSGCTSDSGAPSNPNPSTVVTTEASEITKDTSVEETPAPVETEAPAETEVPTETEAPTETETPIETETPKEETPTHETNAETSSDEKEDTPQNDTGALGETKPLPPGTVGDGYVPEDNSDETTQQQTSTVAVSGTFHYDEGKKVLDLVNNYRLENGLNALTWNEDLATAAKIRAAEASICWAHTRPNGTAWYTVSDLVKGENLAKGYSTAEETFNAWLASDGHRENILWPEFTSMYVVFFEAENGWFWAQEFSW